MFEYNVYDDQIEDNIRQELYEWAQTREYFCLFYGLPPRNYSPVRNGKSPLTYWGNVDPKTPIQNVIRRSLYRYGIGWDDASCQRNGPLAWKLFQLINEKYFEGQASLEGPGEMLGMLASSHEIESPGQQLHEYHGLDAPGELASINLGQGWTSFINARPNAGLSSVSPDGGRFKAKDIAGGIHKDTEPGFREYPGYYSVVFNLNPVWLPSWEGELFLYNDEETEEIHRNGWSVGWPEAVIAHKPGRLVIYDHRIAHRTNKVAVSADEMSFKVAFRVKDNRVAK